MAMQKCHIIKDPHNKQITSICYNPLKHEIAAGLEDGTIKTWDCVGENIGKLTKTCHEHDGWVNCLLYWPDAKLLLSAANDGKLIAWGSSMLPMSVSKIGTPIYCMAWNIRRSQIILGVNSALKVYTLKDPSKDGKMLSDKPFVARDHTDLVKGVVCHETRVYSVGFDRKFCIYDSYAYPDKAGLKLVSCLYPAHESGITTLSMAKDNENNTWLLTGSFDKTVKVWSQDGQVMHKFDGLGTTVTGVCFVPPVRTIWIAAGTSDVPMFDPKSGDNVSEFSGTFHYKDPSETNNSVLQILLFIQDLNQVIATDCRKQICIWKYNPTGCITALRHKYAVEALTYTKKIPMLIFSGDSFGQIMKWERLQSNHFMYSKECLSRTEALALLTSQIAEQYEWASTDKRQLREQIDYKPNTNPNAEANVALLKLLFVEELDLLIGASEDNNIYVWGFDYDAVGVLQQMKPKDDILSHKFAFLLRHSHIESQNIDESNPSKVQEVVTDSVTDRVAGFICKAAFTNHKQCVSGLAVVPKDDERNNTYLISAGWDRRIFIWNLDTLCLHDVFRHPDSKGNHDNEMAADGIIVDLVYCQERDEFAYCSADKLVYIRAFSEDGSQMKLKAVLQGHEAEVTQVRWNSIHQKWVTGSDDCTIRVWSADGMNCELVLSTSGGITAMCIDQTNGCVVVGIQEIIRVYDIKSRSLVQSNIGHRDCIRSLIHIPERQQYVSASWDKTVRAWNAFKGHKKKPEEEDNKEDEEESYENGS